MADDDAARVSVEMEMAISDVLGRHELAMLGGWILVAETTEVESGLPGVWLLAGDSTSDSTALGLLDYAQTKQRAIIIADG